MKLLAVPHAPYTDTTGERGAFDIPLLDENGFERAHPQFHVRKMGTLIVIVIMFSHRRNIANRTAGVHLKMNARMRAA